MADGEADGGTAQDDTPLFPPPPDGDPVTAALDAAGRDPHLGGSEPWFAARPEPVEIGPAPEDWNQGATGLGGTAQRGTAHAAHRAIVHWLLDEVGGTYSAEAEIPLADRPAPLYRLLVLATLLGIQTDSGVAVRAARELAAAGLRTPGRMLEGRGEDRVAALDRAGCESVPATADALAAAARRLVDRYRGDLRRLRGEGEYRSTRIRRLLAGFAGMGDRGAAIFAREAQAVWPELRPSLDHTALAGARRLGLPSTVGPLAALVPDTDLARLAAALTRVAADPWIAAPAPTGGNGAAHPASGANSTPSPSPSQDTTSPIATP